MWYSNKQSYDSNMNMMKEYRANDWHGDNIDDENITM